MSGEADPSQRMAERTGVSRPAFWLYVEAPRWLVTLLVLAPVVAVVIVVSAAVAPVNGDPVETLFQALVGATVTGVTLVVTLNQLVLSQELGAVGDQRERLEDATDFRRDVEDAIDGIAPTDPAAFVRSLLSAVVDRAGAARTAAGDGEGADAVAELADRTTTSAEAVRDELEDAEFGTFAVTNAALDFDYSRRIDETRRVRAHHDLAPDADGALGELVDTLELYGVTREHVKTLYFQRALISLSRSILAAAVPALAVGIGAVLSLRPGEEVTSVLVLGLAVGVTLSPFAVLVAYVLRIATVTGRTLSIGPFTLRSTDRNRIDE